MKIDPHPHVDLEGLTKARVPKVCSRCTRGVLPGEYHDIYHQRGQRVVCIRCVTENQMLTLQQKAADLKTWIGNHC
jgi:ribosomal protein S27AE